MEHAEQTAHQHQELVAHSQDIEADLQHCSEANAQLLASYNSLHVEHDMLLAQVSVTGGVRERATV